ncbi:hypothetical protein EJB05_15874, partial [Eragrostis curvula]
MWLITHSNYVRRGVHHIHVSFSFLVPSEWVVTGIAIAPACMAMGVVVFMDHDTHTCNRALRLSKVCAKVEHAAASYLLAALLNLAIALRVSWALAKAHPIH